ncbi:Lrp/AsnC family transcriptional regulator [Streptomyces sp. NPDC002520]
MHGFADLDELDLSLLNALQVAPRVPWSLIGEALEVDAATASRRWAKLSRSGRAWMSVYPGVRDLTQINIAFIEVACEAGAALRVAAELAAERRVSTVEHTTGDHDLLLTVHMPSLAALSEFLLTGVGVIAGVRSTRAHLATTVLVEGSSWRLRTLDAAQKRRLEQAVRIPAPQRPRARLSRRDLELAEELAPDGRASYSDLAARLGLGVSTVRRRVDALLADGSVVVRCEVAQPLSGWPVSASLWGRVPPARLGHAARKLAAMPETRLCTAVTGSRPNLLLAVWLRGVGDMQRLETVLGEQVPELEVVDRALSLRHVKRMGWLLDEQGCAQRHVPLSF